MYLNSSDTKYHYVHVHSSIVSFHFIVHFFMIIAQLNHRFDSTFLSIHLYTEAVEINRTRNMMHLHCCFLYGSAHF